MKNGKHDARKLSVYLPKDQLEQVLAEAKRQDRSISWLLQRAWHLARHQISKTPDLPEKL
jgi:uncharacterized small protein (TIGR04563 family)